MDTLAISAAVVQFVDIGLRVSIKLGGIYSDLRDVPARLHRLKLDIEEQIAFARFIQSSHATFWGREPSSTPAEPRIDGTVADYLRTMEQLSDLLQSIATKDNAGRVRKSWNAIRALHKHKDALALCDILEGKKSTIDMWLSCAQKYISPGNYDACVID
jgi:hypothetical protein